MNAEDAKSTTKLATKAAVEFSQNRKDTCTALQATKQQAIKNRQLFRSGNQSFLIKAGLALLVFPEPIVSDMLGSTLLAAGAIQQGIKRQSIYVDDLPKAFKSVMKNIKSAKELI